ncbi:dimethylaniline monooxygenase [Dactylonectria macrodidyma]|uniref:Dimethylaniline monooxygenase n=1 Tax=Dactylonectria macrodidyma TaxID=307937 RepID=A0A9P9I8X2_9HYPO|nr:dimethylaniline monooxygenase [Dactylonectria macrodidyma]
MRVAVIGGGPSGLVTLKYLIKAHLHLSCEPVDAQLFEYQPEIGGTFAFRSYEDAELVSSKQLTTFSDFRHADGEDFLSTKRYVEYLRDYCTHFDLWPYIKLRARVLSIARRHAGAHIITYRVNDGPATLEWECDAVAICSGLHVEPNIPDIRGINNVHRVIHSSEFKTREQFGVDQTVMIVGSGETGADIAYLAVTSTTRRVLLWHRDGFHFAPKRNPGPVLLPILGRKPDPSEPGIPIDVSRANLFDTTYVHPLLRNSMILWDYYSWYIKVLLWLSSGTTAGMDQWIGEISRKRHHPSKIFFNKSMKVCPFISLPYRHSLRGFSRWLYAVRWALVQVPIPDTNGKQVDLAPLPKEIDSDGVVHFLDNGRPEYDRLRNESIKPDIIVLCTGYKQTFPFLSSKNSRTSQENLKPNVRGIWNHEEPTLGYIGFVRPSLGAIPPLAEMQAQLWILNLLAPQKVPRPLLSEDEAHYRLLCPPDARVTYGVDHESYVYQLALDMNSAPGVLGIVRLVLQSKLLNSWRLPIIWAFGAHFNTKFRLQGPWKWDGAQDLLASEEFWNTIQRRPLLFGKAIYLHNRKCIIADKS